MSEPDWVRLQKKIFTRWSVRKLKAAYKEVEMEDISKELSGYNLASLIEVLSEQPGLSAKLCPKKCKIKAQEIDSASNALDFARACGVEQKIQTSPENLVNGDEIPVMGLVWQTMLTFMKFGDDEDESNLDAAQSLMLWLNNQIKSYGLVVKNFKSDFHNGMVLAALIHKFRPKLIDYHSMAPSDNEKNLITVFDAAEKFFDLEQYLDPSDIPKLDDKSMVVYVSEYYYGIAEQRALDLAARRIRKLIIFTKENDRLKGEYKENAATLNDSIAQTLTNLSDREVDNTMAGAEKRLADFQTYKTTEKSDLNKSHSDLEGAYSVLSLRLSEGGRPAFAPGDGLTLQDFAAKQKEVSEAESALEQHLNKELNRQHMLVKLNENHQGQYDSLKAWFAEKEAYLSLADEVKSSAEATAHLNVLDAFVEQYNTVKAEQVPQLKEVGAKLAAETYENIGSVQEREGDVDAQVANLDSLEPQKRARLQADLELQLKREALALKYGTLAGKYQEWVKNTIELINRTFFGVSLEEIEAYEAKLGEHDAAISASNQEQVAELQGVWDEGTAVNFDYFQFTPAAIDDIKAKSDELGAAQESRQATFNETLERERTNDQLCKSFADLANPFAEKVEKLKDEVNNMSGELKEQLDDLQQRIGGASSHDDDLNAINAASQALQDAGVTYNRYSPLTSDSVKLIFDDYLAFLDRKKALVEDNIKTKEMRGLTQEQFDEIDNNWKEFDSDGSGQLSRAEIKGALFSLGYDKSKKEVTELIEKFGDGTVIDYNGFREFMIQELGDTQTQEEIVQGFELINKGAAYLDKELTLRVMEDEDVDFILTTAPPKDEGHDYAAWAEEVFSR